jgi:hypothetical protein
MIFLPLDLHNAHTWYCLAKEEIQRELLREHETQISENNANYVEQLTVAKLIMGFLVIYGILRLITKFLRARHWVLS